METETIDLKQEQATTEPDQSETATETKEVKEESEDISQLPTWAQERLKKVEADKENYKKGMMKYKTLSEEPEKREEQHEEYPDWDETSKKFQKQTLSEAERVAEKKVVQVIEKNNEQSAISQFIEAHPEFAEDSKWSQIVANYHPKEGRQTPAAILKDLERSRVLFEYENGIPAKKVDLGKGVADMAAVSKTTSKATSQKGAPNDGAMRMAARMKINLNKLAEEDDSLTATIKI